MAGSEYGQTQVTRGFKCMTLNEAVEYMKARDKYPTYKGYNWISCKTGKPVYIGYN